ncbi:MAG: methionine synthase [Deltaproteobacteria bacterium RIFCSPLOWO2_12_FULL_40_28]|nr:MAG: methionine synthase [Deltaproteobacteria bacterium RIFCSPHIGHO2_02_FULL_40_28]OGQ20047.1 MAG: methionine synthase [Deltaproteobacteria bacterium RIFCSPHIGHO2_12_FULL_40_32]OGQ40614.1 MAG: methionine synthase [Deltaproteobacteria bacterium RIFCSPLOWO2_02_FULL_40_36]OGQ54283.1 MAG: methionine synthase [Deltaproteobacteria bacterium RIFCSPLOWO2_12_FULL_40_28]
MNLKPDRTPELKQLFSERILVLDGAMGTMLQQKNLTAEDFGGADLEGCNENLVLTRPDVILDIHRKYFEAGADLVETNTFGATPLVLGEYKLAHLAHEINVAAAQIARKAADEFSTTQKPRFVIGSMGPTTKAISVTGGVTFDQLIENFYIQAKGLIIGGIDILVLETAQDTRNIKAGVIGINKALSELRVKRPLIVSGTIEPMGTMLAGQNAEALVVSLSHVDLLAIGLNCATGPEFMTDHIRSIHELAPSYVSCYPNAGLPNEDGSYLETPQSLAKQLERFVDFGWINMVGGCCGTTEKHIAAIVQMVAGKKPRKPHAIKGRSFYSGIELVEATLDTRPLIVGERTNVIGSRLFKDMVNAEKWDEATDVARRQIKNGAQVIDVCLQSTDRDELPDIDPFYAQLIKKIKAPLMIDTTDPKAIEAALTYCQGKSIINSINLEDGEEKFERVVPLIKKYGAAVIVGTIDEDPVQAQAFTRERKLEVAKRSHQLLTKKYGVPEEDIIFDPLVFPCATGDANYIGGAVETIEGIRLIKKEFPHCKTVLGISNISFGLPPAAREIVNSVFLYHCTQAGLDLAIVSSEKLERFASIAIDEKKLAEDLLFNSSQKSIAAIADFYRGKTKKEKKQTKDLLLDQRLANYIIEGSKDGLIDDLNLKLKEEIKPLDIINGPLMAGISEVGRLFNNNELIVAEVLQSAEAMKAAVAHLEGFMEKSEVVSKGKIILATVKGDVHDIGKNLVEIILKNNGYEVINLGIKVPPEELIKAYKEHKPDMIGLSGLLVKSAQQMSITVGDLKNAGIAIPILVGGAALSDQFTRKKIAPHYSHIVLYAKDAMTGLGLANKLMDPKNHENLLEESQKLVSTDDKNTKKELPPETEIRSSQIRLDISIPSVPSLERKVRSVPQLKEVWSYINPQMLYVRHLGFKGNFENKLADRDPKALELFDFVENLKEEAAHFMKVSAVWQFFEAESEGNKLCLFDKNGKDLHSFRFYRQRKEDGLCLSDYILSPLPGERGGGEGKTRDHIALFVVTAGKGIREKSEEFKNKGEYLKSHALQSLAIETAEACAEWMHRRIREDWGFPDDVKITMKDRFVTKYRGKRYSFGYPACPDLKDQEGIWKLLKPEEIGVGLTEGYMMDPEASVSAIVFHHPDCIYFGVGDRETME